MSISRFLISFLPLSMFLAGSLTPEMTHAAPPGIHRVRPPQGTTQFEQEAGRVRLEVLTSRLHLSDDQHLALLRLMEKKQKHLDRLRQKRDKAEERYKNQLEKIQKEESCAQESFIKGIKDELSAEQYDEYVKWVEEMGLNSDLTDDALMTAPDNTGESSQQLYDMPAPGGKIGPIVKAPDPVIMYEQ